LLRIELAAFHGQARTSDSLEFFRQRRFDRLASVAERFSATNSSTRCTRPCSSLNATLVFGIEFW
jgi:hypothetical protein